MRSATILPNSPILSKQVLHDEAMNVREPKIAALEAIGQLCVIDSQQVKDRGVKVVDVNRWCGK